MHLRINSSYPQVKIGCQLPRFKSTAVGALEYQYEGPRIYMISGSPATSWEWAIWTTLGVL